MNQTPSHRFDSPHELSFISLEDDAKRLKKKSDDSANNEVKNTTEVQLCNYKNRHLNNKYIGCPWIVKGKHYCKGIVG